jgi:hypothetical protein
MFGASEARFGMAISVMNSFTTSRSCAVRHVRAFAAMAAGSALRKTLAGGAAKAVTQSANASRRLKGWKAERVGAEVVAVKRESGRAVRFIAAQSKGNRRCVDAS